MGGDGVSKKQMALNSGYSANVANSIKSHIETKPGFHNAMSALATDSHNLALAAMHEFKARGFEDFSNKELIAALNAIGSAWSKFNPDYKREKRTDNGNNKLRTVVLQQIENQNITQSPNPLGTQPHPIPTSNPLGNQPNPIPTPEPLSPYHAEVPTEAIPGELDDPMDF
ncbi:MAG: hypothetical protein KAS32_12390 [Candidatus Peribacteraceae bacterium]|nr:hypothetical protein [Candidatus Peribacteraceae bacterium]